MQPELALAAEWLTIRFSWVVFSPFETVILVLAGSVALASVFRLWRIAERERREPRLAAMRIGSAPRAAAIPATPRPGWYGRLGGTVAASPIIGTLEQEKLLAKLAGAGIRRHGSLATLVASKVGAGTGLTVLAWLVLQWHQWFAGSALIRSIIVVAALFVGWRLPDFVVDRLAARRRTRIEHGIPDALDLLVVCAESGLSLDQSIEQVSQDLRFSHPEVAEEFAITAAEMRVVSDRGAALESLVRRTRLETLRSITATLSQAIRFGTPLAESMRVIAAEMRTTRLLRIEERAARLPVLLTIPLLIFIMPALFIIIGTPVVLRIFDFFRTLHIGGGIL
jgi:tight adherence protein C